MVKQSSALTSSAPHVLWITSLRSQGRFQFVPNEGRSRRPCSSIKASVAGVILLRALALETRLLRLRHRPELPEAKKEHRSKGEEHLDDAIIFLVHARSALEAFRTLEPFEDAEHPDKGFAPAHDRVRGSPRNGMTAPRGFNEKLRAS